MNTVIPEIEGKDEGPWTEVIGSERKLLHINFREVWGYRDLILLLMKRDFTALYKQTILGPLWVILQPLLVMVMFSLVFGRIAGLSTNGVPVALFYLAGIVLWNYFSECLTRTSTVFKDNAHLFGKVYFPRMVIPISLVGSNLVRLAVQFVVFLGIWIYYAARLEISPNGIAFLFPVLIILMAGMSLGIGMIITACTTRYRDLAFVVAFGIQLLMYASPVIYPLSALSDSFRTAMLLNPLTSIFEAFRYGFLGAGNFSWMNLTYSSVFTLAILSLGVIIYNRVERSFMDTI